MDILNITLKMNILATRWICNQHAQSLVSSGGRLQLHLVAGIRDAHIRIKWATYKSALSPNKYKVSGFYSCTLSVV